MDKNAIKRYAVWARNELIARVTQKAQQYGITADEIVDANADSINGNLLTATEKKQRQALIKKIETEGFEQVMEEVAYTWFNRFTALRFMEVNNYLPSHVRVFTNDDNEFKPQILAEAINLELDGLDMDKVFELMDANKDEELYKYLLIVQCNALNEILPRMFQKIADYSELLLPDYLLREGSVIDELIISIPEEDWTDQVQIIGWLYQYYNSEPKDKVFAAMKKNIKVKKENIPAATQLFTPDWVVRYMVENSLGRLWYEKNEQTQLIKQWEYFQKSEDQSDEVKKELSDLMKKNGEFEPEKIKCIDPCSGSGHILCYIFDVLVQIYEEYGYTSKEAVSSIIKNNIWGLDIDERAAQLAYFSVMMKARQHDRRFFSHIIQPNVYPVCESNSFDMNCLNRLGESECIARNLINEFMDAKEYGSMLVLDESLEQLFELKNQIDELKNNSGVNDIIGILEIAEIEEHLSKIVNVAIALKQKYDAVVTNPPYMSNRNMGKKTAAYIAKHYPDCKNDTFAVFIDVAYSLAKETGMYAMITQPSIISLSAFKQLRYRMINEQSFVSLIHMGRGIFGVDFGSAAFVVRKAHINNYVGKYMKLFKRTFQFINPDDIAQIYINAKDNLEYHFDFSGYNSSEDCEEEEEIIDASEIEEPISYLVRQEDFLKIPDTPLAYWMAQELIDEFEKNNVMDYATVTNGLFTCDNNRFLRLWYEVVNEDIYFECESKDSNMSDSRKWYPYNKGGNYRKWYGNHEYIVNFKNFGKEISDYRVESGQSASFPGQDYYFMPSLSWSFISAAKFGIRYYPKGFVFDIAGSSVFSNDEKNMYNLLGFLGSEVAVYALQILNPTMNYQAGNVKQLPVLDEVLENDEIANLAKENVELAKQDWDSFEKSWNFKCHPLVRKTKTIKEAYSIWAKEAEDRFEKVKANEKRINEIIISIYGLESYISPNVDEKYITIVRADLQSDIKSFISYAVGCMFGRYSIDKDGLIYAGGTWDSSKYNLFHADSDNIIPICDDEYFDDDIVGEFIKFVKVIYGEEMLEENLKFIADALDGKGSARDVIRNYFINDFYKDHIKLYQKRPIYWLFDSGKKNGFKCLVYLHRYMPDTIARIRTDYVHEQQSRYRTIIGDIEQRIDNGISSSERVKLNKQLKKVQMQAEELRLYEEKIHHLADQMIDIDLDDGVKVNYAKFQDVLAKIK